MQKLKLVCCLGCGTCFKEGICPTDRKDVMGANKNKLLEADLIIFATPVYFNQVSGTFKNFLDRIAYWSHLLYLKGKPCIIIVTAQNSGVDNTLKYLFSNYKSFYLHLREHNSLSAELEYWMNEKYFEQENFQALINSVPF